MGYGCFTLLSLTRAHARFLSHEIWVNAEQCQCRRCIGRSQFVASSSRTPTHTHWPLDPSQFQYMLISLDFKKNSDLYSKGASNRRNSKAINVQDYKGSWDDSWLYLL